MSNQDKPEAAGRAPAREPAAAQSSEQSGGSGNATPASTGPAGAVVPRDRDAGRRHSRRRPQRGGGGSGSGGGGGEHEPAARLAPGQQPARKVNLDEMRELFELVNEQGFTEFEIEQEGFRLHISKYTAPPPMTPPTGAQPFVPPTVTPSGTPAPPTTPAADSATPAAADSPAAGAHILTSPIVGTFYRAPSPETGPFVEVGSRVHKGQVVCIIEAMKLMNEIESDDDGVVVEIYPQNAQAVEFGEPLFAIKPA